MSNIFYSCSASISNQSGDLTLIFSSESDTVIFITLFITGIYYSFLTDLGETLTLAFVSSKGLNGNWDGCYLGGSWKTLVGVGLTLLCSDTGVYIPNICDIYYSKGASGVLNLA